jgi:homoserine trans-succinylase
MTTLISNLQNVSSSYQQLLSLITSQSIDINTDYSNIPNFVFFSSAKQRLTKFYNKVKEIEDYNNLITAYTPLTSSKPNLVQ